jgi:DNA-directed RNA polymerase specialized sigma24 family protein
MTLTADAALVQDCLSGKQHAWNTLVRQYTPAVMGLARRHNLTIQDAEDVVQRTWKQVFMKLGQLKETESLGAWIMRIAWHILADFYWAHKMVVPLMDDLPAQNGDMQHSAEIRDALERIRQRVGGNKLKILDAIIELQTLDEPTLTKSVKIPATTLHTEMYRLLPIIREELDKQGLKTHVSKTGS